MAAAQVPLAEVEDDVGELVVPEDEAPLDSLNLAEIELWTEDVEVESETGSAQDMEIEKEAIGDLEDIVSSDTDMESICQDDAQVPVSRSVMAEVGSNAVGLVRKRPAGGPTPAGHVLRKPARGPRPNEQCAGLGLAACVFHHAGTGKPARLHPDRAEMRCVFCDPSKCRAASDAVLLTLLKKFKDANQTVYQAAKDRLMQHVGDARTTFLLDPWAAHLEHRKLAGASLKPEPREDYQAAVRRDRRVARRKIFFPDKLQSRAAAEDEEGERDYVNSIGEVNDVAGNDTGLPSPPESIPHFVEAWCKEGSWGIWRTATAFALDLCNLWTRGGSPSLQCPRLSARLVRRVSMCLSRNMCRWRSVTSSPVS